MTSEGSTNHRCGPAKVYHGKKLGLSDDHRAPNSNKHHPFQKQLDLQVRPLPNTQQKSSCKKKN